MTAGESVRDAAGRLARAGVEEPRREARLLLLATTGLDPWLRPTDELTPAAAAAFAAAVARRERREPFAYITGRREFHGLELTVSPHVLIPRPETELLVERALALAPIGAAVCDLCTGCGAVALALAARRPDLRLWAVDISAAAVEVAAENASRLHLPLALHTGDLWEAVPAGAGAFDLCTCNPPYVDAGEWAGLSPEVRDWEPRGALVPAEGWPALCARLAAGARGRLRPGGWLLCELGAGQAAAAAAIWTRAGLVDLRVHPDLAGIPRVLEGRRPA